MAKIADRTITVNEFQMRTELTVRPKYPNLSTNEVKQLCLNNLIAEKLLALEGQQKSELLDNIVFQAQMKGIKEQKMRERLYFKEAVDPVMLDSAEVMNAFQLAGKEYAVSFFTIHNDSLASKIKNELKRDPDQFEALYHRYSSNETLPRKVVTFKDPDPAIVNDSLYTKPLDVGQVVGPVRLKRDEYIVMRVDNWKYYPAISTSDVQIRYEDVREKLIEKKSERAWHAFTVDMMNGKKVDFDKNTFVQLSKIFFEIYGTGNNTIKRKLFSDLLSEDVQEIKFDNAALEDIMLDQPFLTIDDEQWSVRDFREAYMSHPLVFRYKTTNLKDFQREFHLAILVLIQDHFLTEEAYRQNLDEHPEVKSTVTLWQDSYVAKHHHEQYINKIKQSEDFDPNLMKGKDTYIKRYIDSLHNKYADKISINKSELNKIRLTDINLFVTLPGQPYPVASPTFPEYTLDSEINPGRYDYNN